MSQEKSAPIGTMIVVAVAAGLIGYVIGKPAPPQVQAKAPDTSEKATELEKPAVPHATKHKGHWYAVFPGPLHWRPAKAAAEELGGHLVTIENAAENEFVFGLIQGKKPQHEAGWWTGGNCIDQDGAWRWLDKNGSAKGELLHYLNWADGHPHQHAGDWDYFLIRPDGKWNVHGAIGSGYIIEWE